MQRNSLLNDPVIYEQSDIRKGYNKEFINDNNDIYNKSNDIGVPSITSIANLEYSCKITDILNNQKY